MRTKGPLCFAAALLHPLPTQRVPSVCQHLPYSYSLSASLTNARARYSFSSLDSALLQTHLQTSNSRVEHDFYHCPNAGNFSCATMVLTIVTSQCMAQDGSFKAKMLGLSTVTYPATASSKIYFDVFCMTSSPL